MRFFNFFVAMSRIGKQRITIPDGVTITVTDGHVAVASKTATLEMDLHPAVRIVIADNVATVEVINPEDNQHRALWGTTAALLKNMVVGVTTGYEKKLVIKGVGYTWKVAGQNLTVQAGYSHPITRTLPDGVTASAEGDTLTLRSSNKQLVGQLASQIRSIRPPEPYKGSGIRYDDEHIQRKVGKKAAA